jgi:hypothetical protein
MLPVGASDQSSLRRADIENCKPKFNKDLKNQRGSVMQEYTTTGKKTKK